QFRIAGELEKPRMRWLPRGELSSEDSQAVMKQTILVEEPLEKFKEEMLRTLPQRGERHKSAPIDGNGQAVNAKAATMVLIVGAQRDDPHVVTIETLLDGLGWGRDAFVTQDEFAEPDNWPVELQDLLRGDA